MKKSNNQSSRQRKLRAKEVKQNKKKMLELNCTRKPTPEELRRNKRRGLFDSSAYDHGIMEQMLARMDRSPTGRINGPIGKLMEELQGLDAATNRFTTHPDILTVGSHIDFNPMEVIEMAQALDIARNSMKHVPYVDILGPNYTVKRGEN